MMCGQYNRCMCDKRRKTEYLARLECQCKQYPLGSTAAWVPVTLMQRPPAAKGMHVTNECHKSCLTVTLFLASISSSSSSCCIAESVTAVIAGTCPYVLPLADAAVVTEQPDCSGANKVSGLSRDAACCLLVRFRPRGQAQLQRLCFSRSVVLSPTMASPPKRTTRVTLYASLKQAVLVLFLPARFGKL